MSISRAVQNTGTQIICQVPPDPGGSGGNCGGQLLEVSLLGGAGFCNPSALTYSRNLLTIQRVPTATIVSTVPQFNVFQGNTIVTANGIGFVDSKHLKCKWFSEATPLDPPFGDAIYAAKDQNHLDNPQHPSHNVTYINSFQILCRQPPSVGQQPTLLPAYLEVSLDGQMYSESLVQYAIYGKPAALKTRKAVVTVLAGLVTVVELLTLVTVDSSGHELLVFDQDLLMTPEVRDVSVRMVNLQKAPDSNNATQVAALNLDPQRMELGVITFANITLVKPPTGTVEAEFTHTLRGHYFNATTATFDSYVIEVWSARVTIIINSGDAVALNINREPSNVSNHATDLPLSTQPILEFLDAGDNVVTKPTVTSIGVVAEWQSFVWKQPKDRNAACRTGGLCPCAATDLKALNYSFIPGDAEECFSTVRSSSPTPNFMDKFGKVTFRGVKLIGFHGVVYNLQFRVTIPTDLGTRINPVISRDIHVGRCSPAASTYALEFAETCSPCPKDAVCNGTTIITGVQNVWRATNLSTTFYPCAGHTPCNSDVKCNVTGCEFPCTEGHKGVQCSVCKVGFGKSGDKCVACPPSEEVCRFRAMCI